MTLRCGTAAQRALAYLWAPCGAFIIDEAPQGVAALYHAVALRSCYGRVAAHEVELSDSAEPSQTLGAMPIVVECGDELQLPPVPARKANTPGLISFLENRKLKRPKKTKGFRPQTSASEEGLLLCL